MDSHLQFWSSLKQTFQIKSHPKMPPEFHAETKLWLRIMTSWQFHATYNGLKDRKSNYSLLCLRFCFLLCFCKRFSLVKHTWLLPNTCWQGLKTLSEFSVPASPFDRTNALWRQQYKSPNELSHSTASAMFPSVIVSNVLPYSYVASWHHFVFFEIVFILFCTADTSVERRADRVPKHMLVLAFPLRPSCHPRWWCRHCRHLIQTFCK